MDYINLYQRQALGETLQSEHHCNRISACPDSGAEAGEQRERHKEFK